MLLAHTHSSDYFELSRKQQSIFHYMEYTGTWQISSIRQTHYPSLNASHAISEQEG